jgi:hypothetical protein
VTENRYQAKLIKKLKEMFPGCVIMKSTSEYQQGLPDLFILFNDFWAALEVKATVDAIEQPNQRYFVEQLDGMSFAAFIYPENEAEVLNALQQTFEISGRTRVS